MNRKNAFELNFAVAPGAVIDEHREAAGLTQAELAKRLGFSLKHVNRLIAGIESLSPETALKLESVFGLKANVWLGLEARYQEFQAREADKAGLAAEKKWLSALPHRSMVKMGWIESRTDDLDMVRELRAFFEVGSLNYLPSVWENVQAAYRRTAAFKSHEWAMLAWLAQGEKECSRIQTEPFEAAALKAALPSIKELSCLPGAAFEDELVSRCADLGIALVFVPAPDGARVCGATRWLEKDRALIQLSLRYKTNDQFWFTLFHEIGHVLLHGKREQFLDFDKAHADDQEVEANTFASRNLIVQSELDSFIADGKIDFDAVRFFAENQKVAPGIVVGQLQHRRVLPFNSPLNKLKVSFQFSTHQSH